ncbi:hypothetical protein P3655_06455 [Vibrio parahaemolyticus]|uniref:hypothetical protein n=1 Tax=Vibrio harveyi group TaxID=717610 RepID=UPI00146E2232|nr:hypothetical protein [Vibrio parahaemolyticus]MDF5121844.1 hypothetical protein [Vibrio parahaemolyticus]MDF5224650.1 hypothetical protein [Vibrio parahaemolyticus]MDF5680580.1 hypothetical protein [Vibrio parahaemolyticus]NMT60287.1 hypothetical protein [Vibrio parahaemolyticus]NMU10041.1 hypothetical protein [Vibrio parahaemolyticus]
MSTSETQELTLKEKKSLLKKENKINKEKARYAYADEMDRQWFKLTNAAAKLDNDNKSIYLFPAIASLAFSVFVPNTLMLNPILYWFVGMAMATLNVAFTSSKIIGHFPFMKLFQIRIWLFSVVPTLFIAAFIIGFERTGYLGFFIGLTPLYAIVWIAVCYVMVKWNQRIIYHNEMIQNFWERIKVFVAVGVFVDLIKYVIMVSEKQNISFFEAAKVVFFQAIGLSFLGILMVVGLSAFVLGFKTIATIEAINMNSRN